TALPSSTTFAAVRWVVAVRTFAEMAARPKRHTNPNGPRLETPASLKAFHHALLGGRSKRPGCEAARSDDRGVRGCTPQGGATSQRRRWVVFIGRIRR